MGRKLTALLAATALCTTLAVCGATDGVAGGSTTNRVGQSAVNSASGANSASQSPSTSSGSGLDSVVFVTPDGTHIDYTDTLTLSVTSRSNPSLSTQRDCLSRWWDLDRHASRIWPASHVGTCSVHAEWAKQALAS